MAVALQDLISEAKKNKFSAITNTLSDDDVISVWDNVSEFIVKQMTQQKGVNVPGLGLFSFSNKKIDVGNNKFLLIQRPILVVSEKLTRTHGLTYTKHHISGDVPVVPLNYSSLALASPFDRDSVESCVRDVVQAVSRSLAANKSVELAFTGIGRLTIRENKLKMQFYKHFVNSLDSTGKLVGALQDRPGTVDSVMSERPQSIRPGSRNSVVLPKIKPTVNGDGGRNSMTPIKEENPAGGVDLVEEGGGAVGGCTGGAGGGLLTTGDEGAVLEDMETLKPEEPTTDSHNVATEFDLGAIGADPYNDKDGTTNDIMAEIREIKRMIAEETDGDPQLTSHHTEPPRVESRVSIPLAKADCMSFSNIMSPASSRVSKAASPRLLRRSLSPIPTARDPPTDLFGPPLPSEKSSSAPALQRPSPSAWAAQPPGTPPTQLTPAPPPGPAPVTQRAVSSMSCGHYNSGQELCYLCHQRERLNVPVSFTEERKRREEEQDRVSLEYQKLKDSEAILKEQENKIQKRFDNQKMAAFNLGVAEAVNNIKNARSTEFHPSFVFQKRPYTPPRFVKQQQYYNDLSGQVDLKDKSAKAQKEDDKFLERLEQVQLAEDLAAQREQSIKDKAEQQEQYRNALSAQVKFKPLPMPAMVADGKVFGKHDMTNEKMMENRRRAHNLYKEQLGVVEQRKRDAILQKVNDQREEENMLKRTKNDLLQDRAERFLRLYGQRRNLEDDWTTALEMKKKREEEDKEYGRHPGGLVHEQCDQYRRCGQCKRRLHNCGESNIWRESRYIPGSRLIV